MYDGHGKEGDLCAVFCKDTLPGVLSQELRESRTVEEGLKRAFNRTNEQVKRSIVWCCGNEKISSIAMVVMSAPRELFGLG